MTITPSASTPSAGALAGLKVIDLTRVLGGPYCTMILSDHGAEVIKIEPPQGDETRGWGPPFLEGDASYYLGVNRNKQGIALDLGRPEGREVLLRLLEDADIVVENFKTGTMEKWGLGYEKDLAPRFPRLVHCRVSGFGAEGPLGGLPGYDAILQAMTGLMSINGSKETGPLRLGTPVVDLATGLYSALGIMMAIHERGVSGRGQYLDMTLHDCGMALLHPQAANFFLNGKRPMPPGNAHPNICPYDKFATATGDIFIAIGNDIQFRKMMELLGQPEMADDPRFLNNGLRLKHRPELTALLAEIFAPHDGKELTIRMLKYGLPAGPVMGVDEAMAAEHTQARGMVVDVGDVRTLGSPIKLSRTPGGPRTRPPRFAEHTDSVLTRYGFSAEELVALEGKGVLYRAKK